MDNNLKAAQRRAVQYWFADGLAELGIGVMCLLLAIYFAIVQLLPGSTWVNLVLFVVVFGVAFGGRKLMQHIRQRTTYTHTGYVELKTGREDRKTLALMIAFTMILMGLNLYLVLMQPDSAVWATALCGLIFAFIFGMAGIQTKLVRFQFLAVFCLLMGVGLAFSGLVGLWGAAVLSLITAIVLLAFGSVTRTSYSQQLTTTEQTDER